MTAVIPTDRPKSVRNSCVIKVLVAFYVVTLLFGLFCGCRGFYHRTESDLFLFLLRKYIFGEERYTIQKIKRAWLECYYGGWYTTGGGGVNVRCDLRLYERWEATQNNIGNPILNKNVVQGSSYASNKKGGLRDSAKMAV